MRRTLDIFSLTAGIVFVLLGLALLLRIAVSAFWPLVLIALGAAAVANVVRREKT
jgi:hypothetical protein